MKTPYKRTLSICFTLLAGFSGLQAHTIINDSLKEGKAQAVSSSHAIAKVNKATVIYPDILNETKMHSLDYIERFSRNRRGYLVRTYNKGKKFFPKVNSILKKYGLPQEYRVLIALESGFNANAKSPAGAVGYWQIMDPVAKEYGLKIEESKTEKKTEKKNKKYIKKPVADERKNFNKSTYAAARYLKDRCRNLNNDMLLIVTSYNWGVGNVWNVMEKTGKKSPTFWDIKKYLPAETSAYVMNFIALNVIFHNYDNFLNNRLSFKDELNYSEDLCENQDEGCTATL